MYTVRMFNSILASTAPGLYCKIAQAENHYSAFGGEEKKMTDLEQDSQRWILFYLYRSADLFA